MRWLDPLARVGSVSPSHTKQGLHAWAGARGGGEGPFDPVPVVFYYSALSLRACVYLGFDIGLCLLVCLGA